MKSNSMVIGAGICGMCAGFLLVGGIGKSDFLKIGIISALLTVPTGLIAHRVGDSGGSNRISSLEDKLSKSEKELNKADLNLRNSEAKLKAALENTKKLSIELSDVQQTLLEINTESEVNKASAQIFEPIVNSLQADLAKAQLSIKGWEERYKNLVEESEKSFEKAVDEKLKVAKAREIARVSAENDAITDEAMEIMEDLQRWTMKAQERHEGRKDYNNRLREHFDERLGFASSAIDKASEAFNREQEQYLIQLDCAHQRIANLQRQVAGDLIEPEYLEAGYANEGAIANDIAREVWREMSIPLAVKGFQLKSDGSCDVGYGYSRSTPVDALVGDLNRISGDIAKLLRINKITNIRKHEISDLIVLTFRREAALKESTIKLLAGTAEEFIKYVTSHPIRYRLIADPGEGKTPTTAVMLSSILKNGCRHGNTTRGKRVENTLVTVSYPGALSSLKDYDYPLAQFLKYGTNEACAKSFGDALEDWKIRQKDVRFAEEFFKIWVWDELDNTINSADDPQKCSEQLKIILKQTGHSNIGWIVSGQSVMTGEIKGFRDDDRSLFTEIIIGIPKIKLYLKKYGKGKESDKNLDTLRDNLDALSDYIEGVNNQITDEARMLRVCLVLDAKSPKLFFLPNFDNVYFDEDTINESEKKAAGKLLKPVNQVEPARIGSEAQKPYAASVANFEPNEPKPTMEGRASCPHCGNLEMTLLKEKRYRCKPCNRKISPSKVVFR